MYVYVIFIYSFNLHNNGTFMIKSEKPNMLLYSKSVQCLTKLYNSNIILSKNIKHNIMSKLLDKVPYYFACD